jgi:hypothetical protein
MEKPRSIYEWYQLSRAQGEFLMQIRDLDGDRLHELALRAKDLEGVGRLRTRQELEELSRTDLPQLEDLQLGRPDEKTLQRKEYVDMIPIHPGAFIRCNRYAVAALPAKLLSTKF